MDKDYLALKRASTSRPSGEWNDDDFDVVCDGVVVGRDANPRLRATREAAMAAFAKSWRRE